MLQVTGIEDLYVFDDGEVHLDSNASLGETDVKREVLVETLHVQDRGTFELHTANRSLEFKLEATNITVSCRKFVLNCSGFLF